jgi:PiT family inorganic phosphate transporter
MTSILVLVIVLALAIAWANGANDVSKGIATLVGSGVTNLRTAVLWGTLWTGIGGLAGAFLAKAMVQMFGKGLLGSGVHPTVAAALATIAGAVIWVAGATRKGLPVSTTHAIVGSLVGVAFVAYGVAGVNWAALGGKIFLPLLLSPVISLALTAVAVRVTKALAPAGKGDCVCFEMVPAATMAIANTGGMETTALPAIHVATCESAKSRPHGVAGITLSHMHWLTSGATSFARGLNDTPKMVALALAAAVLSGPAFNGSFIYFATIAVGMVAGSWFTGRRVTKVLANDVTQMNDREGFIANLVTSALVGPGAALGLPMSTTHVASGAIMGLGTGHGKNVNWKTLRDMLLAWVVTLPVAAIAGIAVFYLLTLTGLK